MFGFLGDSNGNISPEFKFLAVMPVIFFVVLPMLFFVIIPRWHDFRDGEAKDWLGFTIMIVTIVTLYFATVLFVW